MELNNTTIGLIILGVLTGIAVIYNRFDLAGIGFGAIAGIVNPRQIINSA